MPRIRQGLLILSTILLSWLLMQVVHEFGHMAAAWLSGGRVIHVVLHPLAISRTDVHPNPHPSIVVWGGPLMSALLPLAVALVFALVHLSNGFLWFFAGFCLIANGAYIGFGSFQRIGDCGEMIRNGTPIWLLWLFGGIAIPFGLFLWSRAEIYIRDGENKPRPSIQAMFATVVFLLLVGILEILLSPQQ
jgi:Peptidase M50B-like